MYRYVCAMCVKCRRDSRDDVNTAEVSGKVEGMRQRAWKCAKAYSVDGETSINTHPRGSQHTPRQRAKQRSQRRPNARSRPSRTRAAGFPPSRHAQRHRHLARRRHARMRVPARVRDHERHHRRGGRDRRERRRVPVARPARAPEERDVRARCEPCAHELARGCAHGRVECVRGRAERRCGEEEVGERCADRRGVGCEELGHDRYGLRCCGCGGVGERVEADHRWFFGVDAEAVMGTRVNVRQCASSAYTYLNIE